jgi:signal transduction histidine kinase
MSIHDISIFDASTRDALPHGSDAPLHIVLVEDSEHDRLAFRRAFRKSRDDITITEYVRAEEALEALQNPDSHIDLIVTDYKLPGMSGLTLCEQLLTRQAPYPLVILTGAGSEHLAVDALKAGVHDYIIKDAGQGYLDLLPLVLPDVVRQYQDRVARQRAEEEIRRMNKELEQKLVLSQKMIALGGLVAEMTHEINTPLSTGITGASNLLDQSLQFQQLYSDGMMRRSDLERYVSTTKETAEIILTNLKRAADLNRSFKVVAVDQCHDVRRQFFLKAYIEEILLSLRPKLKRTHHQVALSCPDQLEIESDPGAFSQILSNLVMNSLIHGFDGIEQGNIAIDVREESGCILLTYHDNGNGIPEEHIGHIFDQFFTTKRHQGGSGLGLNIVHRLVTETLQGQITCESESGKGATFHLSFPRTLTNT